MENNPYAPPKAAVLEAEGGDDGDLILEGRKVAASRGWAWYSEAWRLFRLSPGIWVAITVITIVIMLVLAVVPGGSLVSSLFTVAIFAGFMLGCRDLEAGLPLEVSHLFAGFRENASDLILAGLLYLVGTLAVTIVALVPIGIVFAIVMPQIAPTAGAMPDPSAMMGVMMPLMVLAGLIWFAMLVPLLAALWFSPALIVFHRVKPWPAMKASVFACLKNMVPMLLYGVWGLAFLLLALIPVGLGLLVFIPITWITMYTGYRDIFIRPA